MKFFILGFFAIISCLHSSGQKAVIDSLSAALKVEKTDTGKAIILYNLSYYYQMYKPDSALLLARSAYTISEKNDFLEGQSWALSQMGGAFTRLGNYSKALEYYLEQLKIEEERAVPENIASVYLNIALVYNNENDPDKALFYAYRADSIVKTNNLPDLSLYTLLNIGDMYEKINQLDSALFYTQQCYRLAVEQKNDLITGTALNNLGNIYAKSENLEQALSSYQASIPYLEIMQDDNTLAECKLGLAKVYAKSGSVDSARYFARESFELASKNEFLRHAINASAFLTGLYKQQGRIDSAFAYQEIMLSLKDSIDSRERIKQMQSLTMTEQLRQQELAQQQRELRNKITLYSTLAAMLVLFVIAFLLYRNNLHKQKAYALLHKQKIETDNQKSKVEQTLEELKTTQAQLIQSEKMASLGELTAGIAHEIQNPLNFVNNFSEVNKELVDELQTALKAGNTEEVFAISNDIKAHEEKINHHGKRADAIVKGMLQHSRVSTGLKEPSDINKLADEYLRLAYQGLRAKDNSFNTGIQTDFDESIGKINITPQDIGRVLLNLYNNAFYAVNEKKKSPHPLAQHPAEKGAKEYEPTVSVMTKRMNTPLGNGGIEIRVKDNGNGIPQKIVDKIFQPFFTTKPTGQGTGLGLSLCYDIIKAHGGELKVETKEGEGSVFVIQLMT